MYIISNITEGIDGSIASILVVMTTNELLRSFYFLTVIVVGGWCMTTFAKTDPCRNQHLNEYVHFDNLPINPSLHHFLQ